MMNRQKRYRWTNVVVLVVSVYLLAASVWGVPELVQGGGGDVGNTQWLTVAYVVAGLAGIGAMALSLRSAGAGRVLTGIAGLVALSGLVALRQLTPFAVLSIAGSGLALLAAAFFMGPMPTPEQEGLPRDAPGPGGHRPPPER